MSQPDEGDRPDQRNLVLILARAFASNLAAAMFLVDAEGTVVYYNEAAEQALGRRFIEGHGMPASEWSTVFAPSDPDGRPVAFEDLPIGIALLQRVPAHGVLSITGTDGVARQIEVTGIPLFAHVDDFVGAVAIFWEP